MPDRRLARRHMLLLMGGAAVGIIGRGSAALASPGPEGFAGRGALSPGAGPPTIPKSIKLRLADGSLCSINMEEYLKGVVPAEMPASWPIEALKAQAVAARTYAAAYVATFGYVCATSVCQNWNPASRNARTDVAVDATRGELMTYGGEMIWSYYASTCGGQTANSPDAAVAYCRSVRCAAAAPTDLSSESAAAAFWKSTEIQSFCRASSLFRWTWSIPRTAAEAILDRFLPSTGVGYKAGQLGQLSDLAVRTRAYSGKITDLQVNRTWNVKSDGSIRSVLRSSLSGSSQPSANVVLAFDGATVSGWGGGFGHGIGMCQWGAKGMAESGSNYRGILQRYYTSIGFTIAGPAVYSLPGAGAHRFFFPWSAQGGAVCS